MLAVRHAVGRSAIAVILLIGIYAERVDDWMFGWRFAVAHGAVRAIVLALAVDRLPRRAAAVAAAGIALWSGVAATAFLRTYQAARVAADLLAAAARRRGRRGSGAMTNCSPSAAS